MKERDRRKGERDKREIKNGETLLIRCVQINQMFWSFVSLFDETPFCLSLPLSFFLSLFLSPHEHKLLPRFPCVDAFCNKGGSLSSNRVNTETACIYAVKTQTLNLHRIVFVALLTSTMGKMQCRAVV